LEGKAGIMHGRVGSDELLGGRESEYIKCNKDETEGTCMYVFVVL